MAQTRGGFNKQIQIPEVGNEQTTIANLIAELQTWDQKGVINSLSLKVTEEGRTVELSIGHNKVYRSRA